MNATMTQTTENALTIADEIVQTMDSIGPDDLLTKGNEWQARVRGIVALLGYGSAAKVLTNTNLDKLSNKAKTALPLIMREVAIVLKSAENPSLSVTIDGQTFRASLALTLAFGKAGDVKKTFKAAFNVSNK